MRQCPRGLTSKPINLSNFGKVITRHIIWKLVKMSHLNSENETFWSHFLSLKQNVGFLVRFLVNEKCQWNTKEVLVETLAMIVILTLKAFFHSFIIDWHQCSRQTDSRQRHTCEMIFPNDFHLSKSSNTEKLWLLPNSPLVSLMWP